MSQQKVENDLRKYFMIKSPRKNVADLAGVEPPDHQSDTHPTEPPRLATEELIWGSSCYGGVVDEGSYGGVVVMGE